jgi:hypothetical protein
MPNQVSITIYNSAGELVKNVFNGPAQYQPGGIGLSTSLVQGGGSGSDDNVFISFPGYLMEPNGQEVSGVSWLANNNNGQLVASGIYTIEVQITNNFGQVTTLLKTVQVIDVVPENSLTIYNSAGEVVANIPLTVSLSIGVVSVSLTATSYDPDYSPSTGQATKAMDFFVTSSSGPNPLPLQWWGTNDQGAPVASGTYTAQLVYYAPGGTKTIVDKPFTVISSRTMGFTGLFAVPNPAQHGDPLEIMYNPISLNYSVVGMLYNLDGQLVEQSSDPGPSPLVFRTDDLASGVYIAVVEMTTAGSSSVVSRGVVKVAIIR